MDIEETIGYGGISKTEAKLLGVLQKNGVLVFRIKDLELLFGIDRTKAYNIVKSMKKKNLIHGIGKNSFALKNADDFVIGAELNWPSYLSFWSALNYYNLSDNTPSKIFYATTKYHKSIGKFTYVTLLKKRFFGYTLSGNLAIAEKEKSIIDCLLFPKYAGGISEIVKSLKAGFKEINIEKLIDYAFRTESKIVLKRLGWILESLKYPKKAQIERMNKKIGRGYSVLDSSLKRKNKFNKRWLLDINIE